jgi:hypothetical protein
VESGCVVEGVKVLCAKLILCGVTSGGNKVRVGAKFLDYVYKQAP